MMNREEAIKKLEGLLTGITETEETPHGWWETSSGAAFGEGKLRDLKDLIYQITKPEPKAVDAPQPGYLKALEMRTFTSEAVFFECTEKNAHDVQKWIINSKGRVEIEHDVNDEEAVYLRILSTKGAWDLISRPGWIVREPNGEHKFYNPRDFRLRYGAGTWRMRASQT